MLPSRIHPLPGGDLNLVALISVELSAAAGLRAR